MDKLMIKKHFPKVESQPGFLNIGRQWAKDSLDNYKKLKTR